MMHSVKIVLSQHEVRNILSQLAASVNFDDIMSKKDDIQNWCTDNCIGVFDVGDPQSQWIPIGVHTGDFLMVAVEVSFSLERDAALFKLFWQ
jgi:hypothetical protein